MKFFGLLGSRDDHRNVVPVQRWTYLRKEDLQKHAVKYNVAKAGSVDILARALSCAKITYSQVINMEHLREMLRRENKQTGGARPLLEGELASSSPPPLSDLAPPANKRHSERSGPAGSEKAVAQEIPKQWRRALDKLAADKKMSKAMCTAKLAEWGYLDEDSEEVCHIVPPQLGGADHPHNFVIFTYPADYHLGERKAKLHAILMLELLGDKVVRHALVASHGQDHADAELQWLKTAQKELKDGIRLCSAPKAAPRSQGAPTGAATPEAAQEEAAGDGAGPSRNKRQRTDGASGSRGPEE